VPSAMLQPYGASKAFVNSFSQAGPPNVRTVSTRHCAMQRARRPPRDRLAQCSHSAGGRAMMAWPLLRVGRVPRRYSTGHRTWLWYNVRRTHRIAEHTPVITPHTCHTTHTCHTSYQRAPRTCRFRCHTAHTCRTTSGDIGGVLERRHRRPERLPVLCGDCHGEEKVRTLWASTYERPLPIHVSL
jgi:hypothetical protein